MLVQLIVTTGLLLGQPASAASTSVGEGTGAAPIAISSPSINPGAQQGKKSQDNGSMMNMMAGIAMLAACMATQPPNMAMCAMGAMAMAQGGADKDASKQSGATQMATSVSGAGTNGSDSAEGDGGAPGTALGTASRATYAAIDSSQASLKDKAAAKSGVQALSEAGYQPTTQGMSNSNGSNIPASAFNSSGGMVAAGFDPNQVKDARAMAAKVSDDLAKYKGLASVTEGGGGPGGGTAVGDSSGGGSDGPRLPAGFVNPFAITDREKNSMIAGKTVTFDGEPIGVRGDNIFEMIHAAYARKTAGKHFIETDHDPELGAVRAPASLPKPLPPLPPRK